MLRILSFALILLTLSCKNAEGSHISDLVTPEIQFIPKDTDDNRQAAAASPITPGNSVALIDPNLEGKTCKAEDAPTCPEEEYDTPYRCVALKNNGQLLSDDELITGFGTSPCQARKALYLKACAAKIILAQPDHVSCHPYANEGACPAVTSECKTTVAPTRCFAENYEDQALTWSSRPEAWGGNECDARNRLNKKACDLGLNPKAMKDVRCEAEVSTLTCPPIWKNCVVQTGEMSECRLSKVGEINLKKPFKAIGNSRCEATYRVQELACRFQSSEIKEFTGIECQALGKPGPDKQAKADAEPKPEAKEDPPGVP